MQANTSIRNFQEGYVGGEEEEEEEEEAGNVHHRERTRLI
jgi:hypothetical protein